MTQQTLDALQIRRKLGRNEWAAPEYMTHPGAAGYGWRFQRRTGHQSIIISEAPFKDGNDYIHASIAGRDVMPTYYDLTMLHKAVFGGRYAYQVFAPKSDHVNIHGYALHLWGRADGTRMLPDFGKFGSI
jgi:hypothetical protein